jgi:hypothetical protein
MLSDMELPNVSNLKPALASSRMIENKLRLFTEALPEPIVVPARHMGNLPNGSVQSFPVGRKVLPSYLFDFVPF